MSEHLKSIIQDLINGRSEQASVTFNSYVTGKTQQLAGLTEARDPELIQKLQDEVEDWCEDNEVGLEKIDSTKSGIKFQIQEWDLESTTGNIHDLIKALEKMGTKVEAKRLGWYTVTVQKPVKGLTEAKLTEAKGSLNDTQLKNIFRTASMGGRIIADGKTVWAGTASTIMNSKAAKATWDAKGDEFKKKMTDGKFNKVVVKDYDLKNSWITDKEYDVSE